MELVLEIVAAVRRLKTEKQLSLKTPLASLIIASPESIDLQAQEQLIKGVTQAAAISHTTTAEQAALHQDGDRYSAVVVIGQKGA